MKITVNQDDCLGCGRCREILNQCLNEHPAAHERRYISDETMPKMPGMAYGKGWEIRRLPDCAVEALRQAIIECPGQALEIEE